MPLIRKSGIKETGLTFMGLLMTLAVLAVLLGLAMPSWQAQIGRQRLIGSVEAVYAAVQQARHEAILRNTPLILMFQPSASSGDWCFTLTDDPDCDCRAVACRVQGIPQRAIRQMDFHNVRLKVRPVNGRIRFYPARGTTSAGSVALSVAGVRARVIVSSLGRVRVCSSVLARYPSCR